jgi:hypothetical protein
MRASSVVASSPWRHCHPEGFIQCERERGDRGGGIYNEGGTVTLDSSTASGNLALNGGGIYNQGGIVTLEGSSNVSGNAAIGKGGGGIYNESGTATLNSSTVNENTADFNGGGSTTTVAQSAWTLPP